MTKETDLEDRVRVLEKFHDEVRGGRKLLLWIASGLGAVIVTIIALWDRLSGTAQ